MVVVGWKPIGMSPKHYDVATKPLVLDPGHELQQYELKDKRGTQFACGKEQGRAHPIFSELNVFHWIK